MARDGKSSPIGIFDSGVGGLGIFEQIAKALPHEDIVYLGDTKNFPYGKKTVEELHQLTENNLNFLISKHNIKMAVVACNTATTTSLEYLRGKFTIPLVGAVPVVKPACQLTKSKKVVILATQATVDSAYHKNLVSKFGVGVDVTSVGCPELVRLVEAGQLDTDETLSWLKKYLNVAIEKNADVIGLGCTHFPFLIPQIRSLVGGDVVILDSNEPVAKQAIRVLENLAKDQIASEEQTARYKIYATKDLASFASLAKRLLPSMPAFENELAIF